MSSSSNCDPYEAVDTWWDTFVNTVSPVLISDAVRELDGRWFKNIEYDVDMWWEGYINDHSITEVDEASVGLDKRW